MLCWVRCHPVQTALMFSQCHFGHLKGDRGGTANICPGCAGLEGPLIGLFENATMIVLLAALMLFTAFWLPFTIGRCYTGVCHTFKMSTPSADGWMNPTFCAVPW